MSSANDEVEKESPNSKQSEDSVAEHIPATNGTPKEVKGSEQEEKPADGPKEKGLTSKEKKDLAKAQKAARRAAEKQKQQGQPAVDLAVGNQREIPKDLGRKGPTASTNPPLNTQHKRTGSTSAGAQSSLPHRQAPSHILPVPTEPEKETKNVALLDHLYGPPRRTTIAGAGKDVHSAVLALGLQMRNYVVCGSSARCVAMLLAFKRVGVTYEGQCVQS